MFVFRINITNYQTDKKSLISAPDFRKRHQKWSYPRANIITSLHLVMQPQRSISRKVLL
jgi:hypothetical protein